MFEFSSFVLTCTGSEVFIFMYNLSSDMVIIDVRSYLYVTQKRWKEIYNFTNILTQKTLCRRFKVIA